MLVMIGLFLQVTVWVWLKCNCWK